MQEALENCLGMRVGRFLQMGVTYFPGRCTDVGQEGGRSEGWWEDPQHHEVQAPGTDILLRWR